MTPVHQEILCNRRGDCLRACIASILDRPLDHVPNFSEPARSQLDPIWMRGNGMAQVEAMYHWLRPQGLDLYETSSPDPFDPDWGYGEEYDPSFVIASGPSMMFAGSKHVVVAERYLSVDDQAWRARFVHDPNPCGKFIAQAESYLHLLRRAL